MHLYRNNKPLIQNFAWRLSQIFVKSILYLFILLISIRFFTPEQYGKIVYLTSVLMMLLIFCDFGISASASKYTAEQIALKTGNQKKIFASSTILIVIFASATSVFLVLFGKHLFPKYYPQILILLPCLFLSPISSLLDGIYRGYSGFKSLFIRTAYAAIATMGASFILIWYFSVDGALIAMAVTHLFFVLSMIFASQIVVREISLTVMKDISKYACYIGVANISYFMYTQIDILIMEKFGYLNEIAYYGIIDRIFYFIFMPSIILGQVFAPKISSLSALKKYLHIKDRLHLTFFVGFPCSIIVSIFTYVLGVNILKEWGGQYNTKAFVDIFNLLTLLLPLKIWGSFTVNGFITPSGNVRITTILTFIGGVVNIILDLIFIRKLGFIGVFYATLIVHSICIMCVNIIFYKKINLLASVHPSK